MKKQKNKKIQASLILVIVLSLFIPQTIFAKFSAATVGATDIQKQDENIVNVTLNGIANPDNKHITGFFRFAISDEKPKGDCDSFVFYPPWIQTPYLPITKTSSAVPFKITLPFPKDKNIYFCAGATDPYTTTRGGGIVSFASTPLATPGSTPGSLPAGYTFCATEGNLCYSIKKDTLYNVAFGAYTSFVYTNKNTYFICDKNSFGGTDPAPGTPKACYIKEETDQKDIDISNQSGQDKIIGSSLIKEVHTSVSTTNTTHESTGLSGSVVLNPIVTEPALPAYGYFRYSPVSPESVSPIFCNEVFGDNMKSTTQKEITGSATSSTKTFSIDISDLEPNTLYYYCAVASDKKVIKYGQMEHFTTANDPGVTLSSVETKPATSIGSTSVRINGVYNSSVPSATWFEYRKKLTYQDLVNSVATQGASLSKDISLFPLNALVSSTNQSLSRPISTNTQTPAISSQVALQAGNVTSTNNQITAQTVASSTLLKPTASPYAWSNRINYQAHNVASSGSINYLLKNLQKNSTYEFRAGIEINTNNNPQVSYGGILSFRTPNSSVTDGDVQHTSTSKNNSNENLSLGDKATPPEYTVVRYHEGIEHVLVRQLMRSENLELAEMFGYREGMNLENFAWYMADFLARTFGYVSPSTGKELRVGPPDKAAYELVLKDGKLTIYEYFDSEIVAIQDISSTLRSNYEYEYYYTKKSSD
jgi:hypothetical protein